MASEPQALAIRPESPDEDDYRTLCAALEASARGRAFLSEYARRNRNADTEILLDAVNRLAMQTHADAEAVAEMRAVLASVLRLLESRRGAPDESSAAEAVPDAAPPQIAAPPVEEPELPAPSPLAELPAIVETTLPRTPVTTAIMPEVNVLDTAVAAAKAAPPKPASARPETPSGERLRLLAPIMALGEDERLALFT